MAQNPKFVTDSLKLVLAAKLVLATLFEAIVSNSNISIRVSKSITRIRVQFTIVIQEK